MVAKHWGTALAASFGLLFVGGTQVSQAQTAGNFGSTELTKNWNLRIGISVFQSQTSRNKAGEVGFSGVAERTVYHAENYDINVGIGYNGSSDVYNIPIEVNGIAHHNRLRYGIGGGYAFGKRLDGRGMSGTVLTLIAGYKLIDTGVPLNLDLRYNFISGASSELDGYTLTLGAQF